MAAEIISMPSPGSAFWQRQAEKLGPKEKGVKVLTSASREEDFHEGADSISKDDEGRLRIGRAGEEVASYGPGMWEHASLS